jgi:predicted anti-sigma-YlaC factor YlaD
MITVESQGAAGGTEAAARKHFTRAIEVQQGLSPGPYVALAMGVSRPKRDRAEFEKLLTQAASVDPDKNPTNRLPVMIGRQRAQVLLGQADRLLAR